MNILKIFTLLFLLLVTACGTGMTNQEESMEQTKVDAQIIKMSNLKLINRNTKNAVDVIDEVLENNLQKAFVQRERTYEKLMPLFEYSISFNKDGQEEVWRLNKAGYLMKEGTSELYKMDTSMLHTHMK